MDKIFDYSHLQIAVIAVSVLIGLAIFAGMLYLEGRTLWEIAVVFTIIAVIAVLSAPLIISNMNMVKKATGDRPQILSDFAATRGFTELKLVGGVLRIPSQDKFFGGRYKGRDMGLGLLKESRNDSNVDVLLAQTGCRTGGFEMQMMPYNPFHTAKKNQVKFRHSVIGTEFWVTSNDSFKAKSVLGGETARQIGTIYGEKEKGRWHAPQLSIRIERAMPEVLERLAKLPRMPIRPSEFVVVKYELGTFRRIDDSMLQALLDLAVGLAEKAEK